MAMNPLKFFKISKIPIVKISQQNAKDIRLVAHTGAYLLACVKFIRRHFIVAYSPFHVSRRPMNIYLV